MSRPLISVIMASYNHAKFVAQAIDSVLAQQGVEFEFLIADDGSTDETAEVIASVADPRIQFYRHDTNRGACTVTNELIQKASGEYIALINSDDYWLGQDKLAYQADFLAQNNHVGAIFGKALFVDKNNQPIPKETLHFGHCFDVPNRTNSEWLRHFFCFGNCICHPTMLIRKACYDEIGLYNNRLRQLPDLDMWVRLVKKYDIHISERELIAFRILPGENASSQTSDNFVRTINEHYLIAEHFFSGVTYTQLLAGFGDVLKHKEQLTNEHLDIEKALLYFLDNPWLDKPYLMIGLLKMNQLLNSEKHRLILANEYDIDDRWYQQKTAEVDVLRPKLMAKLQQEGLKISNKWLKIKKFLRRYI